MGIKLQATIYKKKYVVLTKKSNTGDKQNKLRLYEGPGITFSQNLLGFLHFI